jgi:hypothetical protein
MRCLAVIQVLSFAILVHSSFLLSFQAALADAAYGPSTSEAVESLPLEEEEQTKAISSDEVSAITGTKYSESTQPADFPNIKQWEFQGGANSVSLIHASGKTAEERMTKFKLLKPKNVKGYLDEAHWEPIQGKFAARSGDRYVEIKLSKSHGSEEKRIEFAKKLGTKLLEGK